ncbi:unnamed protein product [Prunus armeniaca]
MVEMIDVPHERRVTLATFFLARNIRHWWESVRRRYQDRSAITWPFFRATFDGQFYLLAYQNMKMEEFLQLEQGVMSILEYEKNFNELSKYYTPLVAAKSKKCQLFTGGLKMSIRDIVVGQRLTTFADLVMSASLIKSIRGHPRKAVSTPDHPVAVVTEVFELESVPPEALTRVEVLGTALEVVQLVVLGNSYSQSLAGGVAPSAPCVAGTTLGLVNRAPLGAIFVHSSVIFEGSARYSSRAERSPLGRPKGLMYRVVLRARHSLLGPRPMVGSR